MKKAIASLILACTLLSTGCASNVSKAREFIQAGMTPQAIELLDKEVKEHPANADAQFELGRCYVYQGRYQDADARFANAVRLQPEYGHKIGGIYKDAGIEAVKSERVDDARTLLVKAVAYRPDLKGQLVADLTAKGKAAVNQGDYDDADVRFAVAAGLDQRSMKDACGAFAALGDAASDANCLSFYAEALPYCGANDKIGNRLLGIAGELAKQSGKEIETDDHKQLARRYLGDEAVDKALPDRMVLKASGNRYRFVLKKGEKTPYWLSSEYGPAVTWTYYSTNNKFEIHYRNGSIVKIWAGEKILPDNTGDKMLVATEDTVVSIEVKEK